MLRMAHLRILAFTLILLPALPLRAEPPRTDPAGDPLPAGALARLGTVRLRHPGRILHLAFSPDGKTLAAEAFDNLGYRGIGWQDLDHPEATVRLWDPATGKKLRRMERQFGNPNSLLYSEKLLITANDGSLTRFWDPASGKAVPAPEGVPTGCYSADLSFDGKTLAACTEVVRLIDLPSGKETHRFEVTGEIEAFALTARFSPDAKTLAVSYSVRGGGGGMCLWEVATGREVHRLPIAAGRDGMAFSPDGTILAIGGGKSTIHLWDVATGKEIRTLGDNKNWTHFVTFLPGGKELLVVRADGAAVWDVATGKELRRIGENWIEPLTCALSPDGKTLAVSVSHALRLFDTGTGKELRPKPAPVTDVEAVAFSPDDKTALTGDSGLHLWDATTGKHQGVLGSAARVGAAVFTPDGKGVIAGYTQEEALRLWDIGSGKELRRFEGAPGQVEYVGLLAGGKSILSMSQLRRLPEPNAHIEQSVFSLQVWERATGKETRGVGDMMMKRATSSADGRRVAGGMEQLGVWDALTGRELVRLDTPKRGDSFLALALTPDGRRLVTSSWMGEPISFWEIATGTEIRSLLDHDRTTLTLAVSPDGRIVAAGGVDGKVRLWDLDTGTQLRKLTGHDGPILSLAFSPDGRRLITGSRDTTALIWDVAGLLPTPPAVRLKAEERKDLWLTLASPNGVEALRAVRRLASDPERALPLIREQFGKPPAVESERLARLLADLDGEDFDKREAASAELARLGKLAEPALKRALEDKPSAELRRRADELLKKLDDRQLSPATLQTLRGIEVLERIGTPEAREILESFVKRSARSLAQEEAEAALDRLARR